MKLRFILMLFLPLIMLNCWDDDDFYIQQYADDTITSTNTTNTIA